MKLRNRKSPAILAALALLVLSSVACSLSLPDLTSGNAQVQIALKESEINTLLENSTNHIADDDVLLEKITNVDLDDAGFIRIFGQYTRPDGSQANGSYDVRFAAIDGALAADIIAVDIEGASLDDPRIQRVNKELAESLEQSARGNKGEVEFESVRITDDAMDMQATVRWDVR